MDTEACEEYLGCEGVKGNNFDSEEECKQKCVGPAVDCSPFMCMMYCPYGFKADEKGCAICKCYQPCEVNFLKMSTKYFIIVTTEISVT